MKKVVLAILAITTVFVIESTTNSGISLAMLPLVGWSARQRAIYNKVKKEHGDCAPGFLRVEQILSISKNQYKYTFTRSSSGDGAAENKLDNGDVFIASEIGLYLAKQLSTAVGQEELLTYPDPQVFSGNSAADAAVLENIYAGFTELKQGSIIHIAKLANMFFRQVPNRQSNPAITSVVAAAKNQFDLRQSQIELGALMRIEGGDSSEITVNCPVFGTSTAFAPGTNYSYRLVMFLTGYLVKK